MLKIPPAGGVNIPRLSCPTSWPNRAVQANAALIQSHLQLGLLDWEGSVATGTGNPPAIGWINRGINRDQYGGRGREPAGGRVLRCQSNKLYTDYLHI